jgi:2-hydroxychromene-2-carboxylate isomerase
MVKVEFHFDFGSPNAYLSHLVISEIEKRTNVKFDYVPVLLGGVFKLTNNRSPAESLKGIRTNPNTSGLKLDASSAGIESPAFRAIRSFPSTP